MFVSVPSSGVLPLSGLRAGQSAIVIEVGGDASQQHRLAELGLNPGTPVTLLRCGSPCLLSILGHSLSLRLGGDCQIWVQPLAGPGWDG